MQNQFRNFLKHAELVGLFTALIELAWTWFTSVDFHYDDAGCLCSESYMLF